MENIQSSNNEYWANTPASGIMSGGIVPGEEFFKLLNPSAKILDLGCGNGLVTEEMYGRGYDVSGIDINQKAIKRNATHNPSIDYICSDLTKQLPYPDATFDAVTINSLFTSIIEQEQQKILISEIERILKPYSFIWVLEPLVSNDYIERYKLYSKVHDGPAHTFFVFKDGKMAKNINNKESLLSAIIGKLIQRVARHYTQEELDELFSNFERIGSSFEKKRSSNTGMTIEIIKAIYKRKEKYYKQ